MEALGWKAAPRLWRSMRIPPRLVLAAGLALAAAGCASAGPAVPADPLSMLPPEVDRSWVHFAPPKVEVGARAPDFTLPTPDGRTLLSRSTFEGRPLVLVFGSYT